MTYKTGFQRPKNIKVGGDIQRQRTA